MITEAHKRNYEQYVKPYLSNLWPDSLKTVKDLIRRNLDVKSARYDQATLKKISIGYIMQFAKHIPVSGKPKSTAMAGYTATWDKSPCVIHEHPRIVLSDIYIGMWYDDLVKEVQAEQAVHPMASQFLNN